MAIAFPVRATRNPYIRSILSLAEFATIRGVSIARGTQTSESHFSRSSVALPYATNPETASRLDTLWGNVDHLSERSELINISPNYVNVSVANFARIRGVSTAEGLERVRAIFRDQAWECHTLLTAEAASRLDTLWGDVVDLSEWAEPSTIRPAASTSR